MCFYNEDGYADIYNEYDRKARKEHKCDECPDLIQPGQQYKSYSSLFDGSWWRGAVCRRCLFDTRRIHLLEMSRGCSWNTSFPPVHELRIALEEEGLTRTPLEDVPKDFPVMWQREAWAERCKQRELAKV